MVHRTSLRPATRRLLLIASMALFVVSAASASQAIRPARAARTWSVSIGDNYYSPQTVTISIGDTVTWNNQGSMVHTVTADPNQTLYFNSGDMGGGNTFSFTFNVAGNFTYSCAYHDMAGEVVVLQPVPEFPGYLAFAVVAAAVGMALLLERRFRE